MHKVAVILSGCGFMDGSEIHEVVHTLTSLQKNGLDYDCIAPDLHFTPVDHTSTEGQDDERSVLIESARIARGDIKKLSDVNPDDYAALIFPGGFGVAKHLSNYAERGNQTDVNPTIAHWIQSFHTASKPMGFICIAPMLAAFALPNQSIQLTIGNDKSIATVIESKGAKHIDASASEICIDQSYKIVSTPAYMLGQTIAEVAVGIDHLVGAIVSLIDEETLVLSDSADK